MTVYGDLLGPQPTRLEVNTEPADLLESGTEPAEVARQFPSSSLAWATLAEAALEEGNFVTAYAYARVGYHRGIDQLRKSGWKGFGPVPWSHVGNQGFLRALVALSRAAEGIEEEDEYQRCLNLAYECDPSPSAAKELGLTS